MTRRRRPRRSGALTELPPLKILSQIALLQALYYAAAFALMLFTALVSGRPFSLDLVFGWDHVRGDTTQGYLVAFVWILVGGFFGSLAIVAFVQRSKLVLDFALTMHVLHLLVVVLYTRSVPRHLAWWITMAASSAAAVALSTWGCRYRELRPISFGGNGGASSSAEAPTNGEGSSQAADGDEEQGFSRGRGRARGRDGAGTYEMVPVKTGDSSRND